MGEAPELFLPVAGGWGRMGATHIRLATASGDVLAGALQAAWKLRGDKNTATTIPRPHAPAASMTPPQPPAS